MIPFTFEDLDQRLKEAQINPVRRPTTRDPSPIDHPQQRLRSRTNEEQPATSYGAEVVRTRTLNHMRSLHREQQQSAPEGTTLTQPLSRNATTARPRGDGYGALKPLVPPVPDLDAGARKYPVEQASRAVNLSRRPSGEHGDLAPPKKSATMQHPPMPPAPAAEVLATYNSLPGVKVAVVQQRIFIADMQRFHMVEVGPATTAQNVLDTITAQGVLDHWRGAGGWMLYELAQDFGMERPVREYELLADVTKPWNKDKLMNAFMVKMTPLATTLARKAMPTSSPTMCGYIEWEQKRGKWGKRWIELREHGLWLSKKDTGKDEIFLCSLTNFDAYVVTRPHKSPKPFVFAIKSTDSLTMFESAADYVHVFSCSQKDGERWVEAIMLARSYVLYQSQQVLFTGATTVTTSTPPIGASGGLSRAGTRKYSGGQRLPPPLVSVPPPFAMAVAPSAAVFEPGSLLAKRGPVP